MRNLIRMDLYRMRKARGFWVLLILTFVLSFAAIGLTKGFDALLQLTGEDTTSFRFLSEKVALSEIIANPFPTLMGIMPMMTPMLMFLSACIFFGADSSRGYIRNTIGLMPSRAHTILSRFFSIMVHNALFMFVGFLGTLAANVMFRQIVAEGPVQGFSLLTEILSPQSQATLLTIPAGILTFLTKYVLTLALSTVLLWLVGARGSKGFGTIGAVLFGSGMLSALWQLISLGVNYLAKTSDFDLSLYMPDQLLYSVTPLQPYTILMAVGLLALSLFLSVWSFNKRDLK